MNSSLSPLAIKPPRSTADRARRDRFYAILVCMALLCTFYAISWLAWVHKSPTFDEPLHFVGAWMQTHYGDFRVNAEDPPLWKYFAVAGMNVDSVEADRTSDAWSLMLVDNFKFQGLYVKDVLFHTTGNNVTLLIQAARERMILLGVVLALLCASWAWRLGGPLAGVVAASAFCLDPNFLAHAPLVKNDVPLTLVLAALALAVWLVGERGTFIRCIAVLLLPGIALTTKFSGVLAIPMLGLALLIRVILPQPWKILRWTASTRKQRLAVAFALGIASSLIAWLIIWACYDFRFSALPDPHEQLSMDKILYDTAVKQFIATQVVGPTYNEDDRDKWVHTQWHADAPTRLMKWAFNHRVLPQAWLIGFQFTYSTSRERAAFLLGDYKLTGWWYYFPLAMLFKTPLATLMALLFSTAGGIWMIVRQRIQNWWPILAAAVFPIFYLIMALTTGLNLGVRHVLPLYPFIFVLIGVVAAQMRRILPRIAIPLIVIFFLGLATETFAAFPNYIPFFNTAAGGWRGGVKLLSDSNIDWGQELLDLADWQKKHPDRQLYLSYFGFDDPRYYGIHYINFVGSLAPWDQNTPEKKPRVYAISAVILQQTYLNLAPDDKQAIENFRSMQPTEVLGNCLYLYELP